MSNYKRKPAKAGGQPRRDPLASLKMADMMISKPFLPAEILEKIVDNLDVADLVRFARVSKRMREMVYDDTRWNKRLRRMGCWNESEARERAEAQRSTLGSSSHQRRKSTIDNAIVNGKGRPDIVINGHTRKQSLSTDEQPGSLISPVKSPPSGSDGFQTVSLNEPASRRANAVISRDIQLSILKSVQSIRGKARQEYGKIYQVLQPYYRDIIMNPSTSSLIFRKFTLPEQQAQMLAQIATFAKSDLSPGSEMRELRIKEVVTMFSTAALLEFRKGYEYKDIQGRMRQYAHVAHILDDGSNSIDLYLNDNELLSHKSKLGTVSDCVDYSLGYGQLSLERVQGYFERLGHAYAQEAAVIQTVFPEPETVLLSFLEKVAEGILSPFLAALFEDARMRSASTYLRVMSGTLSAIKQFITTYTLASQPDESAVQRTNEIMIKIYEPHIDAYLAEEHGFFSQKANKEIEQWDQALSDQDATTETFLMSNVNRQAEKKDFMSSFRKVVMAPVNILPKMSSSSGRTKPVVNDESRLTASNLTTRPASPSLTAPSRSYTPTLPTEAPTTELAAKAALMETKLENIKSLFSIEVALNLVHAAKSSLDRAAQFISLKGEVGEKARKECTSIFVLLLDTVGTRHVKVGFDKAIEHLSSYNPREASSSKPETQQSSVQPSVAPLTTFLELVNVGDLIQQMLDVFFESELIAYGISRRDDFLDGPVKEKRRFEAMLDERVAAGLGKGIDVLMDEVEYICATEQSPTDYNPAIFDANSLNGTSAMTNTNNNAMLTAPDIDITPTPACLKIISLIRIHHTMLQGSTDKTLLDVFTSELGLRLFQALTKHIKRQRISPLGGIRLLSDLSQYSSFIAVTLKNPELNTYFTALREVAQIFLIEGKTEREIEEMTSVIADQGRYSGVFGVEEVVEFVERRSDWIGIRSKVEGKVRGEGCIVM